MRLLPWRRRPWSLVRRLTGGVVLIAVLAFAAQALVLNFWLTPVAEDMEGIAAEQALATQAALEAVAPPLRPALAFAMSNGRVRISPEPPPGATERMKRGAAARETLSNGRSAPVIEMRFEGGEDGTFAAIFRIPVDDEVWWLQREYSALQGAVSGTLAVWLLLLAVAMVGALLVSVRLIARPISRLVQDIAVQTSQRQAQLAPLPERPEASAELQSLIKAFNGLARQVAESARARQQLLAGVSHDLRTPLARLRLRAETQCEPEVADALAGDLTSLSRIVDQFLAYVQGDSGVPLGSPEPLDRTVHETVLRYAEAGQPVSGLIETVDLRVPDLLVQRLLTNLVDNALAYGAAPVEVILKSTPEGAELAVADHGPGMDLDDFERAQQPFVRLTSARSELGHCGLGLAIVAQMARGLGGRLQARRDEQGRFLIALQLTRQGVAQGDRAAPAASALGRRG